MPNEPTESKHLADLRALAEARGKATGPNVKDATWMTFEGGVYAGQIHALVGHESDPANERLHHIASDPDGDDRPHDRAFICAAANHDFPGLIAHLEKLERVAEKAKTAQRMLAHVASHGADTYYRNSLVRGGCRGMANDLADALAALETKHG